MLYETLRFVWHTNDLTVHYPSYSTISHLLALVSKIHTHTDFQTFSQKKKKPRTWTPHTHRFTHRTVDASSGLSLLPQRS